MTTVGGSSGVRFTWFVLLCAVVMSCGGGSSGFSGSPCQMVCEKRNSCATTADEMGQGLNCPDEGPCTYETRYTLWANFEVGGEHWTSVGFAFRYSRLRWGRHPRSIRLLDPQTAAGDPLRRLRFRLGVHPWPLA